ncbi:hypothetical protein BC777_2978 [Yoonia maricola]|uniref:Autotransporter domain-containing protein n=1 Tax=Yoonia maricola TaxID=420999 RepID=A0A2M8W239_9RHOB|nr:autotransporter outer membrane beta-barrel domain-containing protein [Yoonia maricola]PJI84984.1 hypothetical protein BC777_2978 [Yoonia maricola]
MSLKFALDLCTPTHRFYNVSWTALIIATLSYQPATAQQAIVVADGETVTETVTLDEDGSTLLVEEGGTIAADGNDDNGVVSNGDNVTITIDGTILTDTSNGDGIEAFGDGVTITNNGNIELDGFVATGIQSEGDDATITNNGTITAQYDGIRSLGDNGVVFNNGQIVSTDFASDGIDAGGENSVATNGVDGVIITEDSSSQGIKTSGDFAAAINHGTIVTESTTSEGILITGQQSEAINTGSITTQDNDSNGIQATGAQSTVMNSGTVTTFGARADAVMLDAEGVTLTNNGLLSATGANSNAIAGSEGAQTVTLGATSQIIGTIDLGEGEDTLNIEAAGTSGVMTILGVETLNVDDRAVLNVVTEIDGETNSAIHIIDVTGASLVNDISDAIASDAHRTLQANAGIDGAWASIFGAARTRGNDGSTFAHDHSFAGLLAGYETTLSGYRTGIVAGVAASEMTTETDTTQIDSESAFGGLYLGMSRGGIDLTASLLAGQDRHETERGLFDSTTGTFETATGSFDSNFVSAGLTVAGQAFDLGGLNVKPSGMASYTVNAIDGYTETGTTQSNLTFDDRIAQTLSMRGQLETFTNLGPADISFRAGIDGRFSDEDDIGISIGADSASFAATNSTSFLGGFVGARTTFAQSDSLTLAGDVEYGFADGQESTVAASLNVSFSF